ncbi:hypothetical protein ELUMI_v1c04810 [Williamsoniiplasma luminosum]|uniref:Uncharacterized protein n=1 Tax=Williamsoniiplasma luminosum TaxID=214888 RepID=A0A2K8NTM7_9MOLU|nr:hypothetical protein ELUMI_v1c04810 [Williamsoniiplasma luminosum]
MSKKQFYLEIDLLKKQLNRLNKQPNSDLIEIQKEYILSMLWDLRQEVK